MDKVFRADDQEFTTAPVKFRNFLQLAVQNRDVTEKFFGNAKQSLASRIAALSGAPMNIMEKLEEVMDTDLEKLLALRHPYNFEIDDGNEKDMLSNSSLQTLQTLKAENEKRLNPQYKSISLRAMKYDRIETSLLIKRKRKEELNEESMMICSCGELLEKELQEEEEMDGDTAKGNDKEEQSVTKSLSGKDSRAEEQDSDSYQPQCVDVVQSKKTKAESKRSIRSAKRESEANKENPNRLVEMVRATRSKAQNVGKNDVQTAEQVEVSDGKINKKVIKPEEKEEEDDVRSKKIAAGKDSMTVHLPENDIIVSVSIFFGYSRPLEKHEIRLGRLLKVTDRILLSGEHTLLDLKHSFHCPSDYAFLDDLSSRAPCMNDLTKVQYPSSFFFIHDTFYLDLLPDGSTDISEGIREWASKREEIGKFEVKNMHEIKMIDIIARMGQPYLYVHQGTCEHLVCFNDIQLRDDFAPETSQPVRMVERNFRRVVCAGCQMYTAEELSENNDDGPTYSLSYLIYGSMLAYLIHKHMHCQWSVMDHESLPGSPFFFCDQCYVEFNYEKNGKKRFSFSAVPFCDRKAMDESEIFLDKLKHVNRRMET